MTTKTMNNSPHAGKMEENLSFHVKLAPFGVREGSNLHLTSTRTIYRTACNNPGIMPAINSLPTDCCVSKAYVTSVTLGGIMMSMVAAQATAPRASDF